MLRGGKLTLIEANNWKNENYGTEVVVVVGPTVYCSSMVLLLFYERFLITGIIDQISYLR